MTLLRALSLSLAIATSAAGQSYFVKSYSSEEGLPQNQVFSIAQDTFGYMWFATAGGLSRYDGRRFRNFKKEHGLTSNVVRDVHIASDGNLWCATDEGVNRYFTALDSFVSFSVEDGLGRGIVRQIAEDASGHLWFATAGGLSLYLKDERRFVTFTESDGLPSSILYSVGTLNSLIFLGTPEGLVQIEYQKPVLTTRQWSTADGLPSNRVFNVHAGRDGRLWIATAGGLAVRTDGIIRPVRPPGLSWPEINSISEDRSGNIWVSTESGAFRLDDRPDAVGYQFFSEANGFPTRQFYTVHEDREGNMWFGTVTRGAAKLVSQDILQYYTRDGLIDNTVVALARGWNGTLYIGTPVGLGAMEPSGRFRTYSGLQHSNIWDIESDSAGILWLGSSSGMAVLIARTEPPDLSSADRQKRQYLISHGQIFGEFYYYNFDHEPAIGNNWIPDVYLDHFGRLWFVSTDRGIGRIDWSGDGRPVIKLYNTSHGLINHTGWCIFEDAQQRLWVGTIGGGLALYDPSRDRFDAFTRHHGLIDNVVMSIGDDGRGHLWFGTERGLTRMRVSDWPSEPPKELRDRLHHFTTQDGLVDNSVSALFFDDRGLLWIGGNGGLQQMDASDGAILRTFNRRRGLTDNEVTTHNSIVSDGTRLWIGTGKGLTTLPLQNTPSPSQAAPRVFLTAFTAEDATQKFSSAFTGETLEPFLRSGKGKFGSTGELSHLQNNVAFSFACPSFVSEEDVRFRYRLIGFEADWTPVTFETHVRYTNLDPGEYAFEVQANNGQGGWSIPAICRFSILTPFWKTWWFILFIVTLVGLTAFTVYRFRVATVSQRTAELEKKVITRTRQLIREKENAERLLRELQETQMHLVHSEKMASLGQLVAGVAHEINNPVAYVKANIAYLDKRVKDIQKLYQSFSDVFDFYDSFKTIDDEQHREFATRLEEIDKLIESSKFDRFLNDLPAVVSEMKDGVERTQKIVEDLRNFSRLDESQYKEVDLNESLDSTLNILKNEYKTRVHIHRDYSPLPRVLCNPGQINQVLMNILTNSIQAIEGQGDIWIRTVAGVNNILISIRDNGVGIPEAIQPKIFDPFFTTKPVGRGTGLGLSISFKIIENHKGTIFFDSKEGEGTEFKITLPTKRAG
jgi:signal transduction histidine kinase/ligand-binding sensor domain-containing protein